MRFPYVYLKQDGESTTKDYDEAGLWTLEEAAKIVQNSTYDCAIAPDASNKWVIILV